MVDPDGMDTVWHWEKRQGKRILVADRGDTVKSLYDFLALREGYFAHQAFEAQGKIDQQGHVVHNAWIWEEAIHRRAAAFRKEQGGGSLVSLATNAVGAFIGLRFGRLPQPIIGNTAKEGAKQVGQGVVEEVTEVVAAKTSTKLLNQFNSAESLIEAVAPTFGKALKHGELQGFVKGDANAIFKAITNGGTTMATKNPLTQLVKMPDGRTFITLYKSTSRGVQELHINTPSQLYKIRIDP